jgi:hypothetical protein
LNTLNVNVWMKQARPVASPDREIFAQQSRAYACSPIFRGRGHVRLVVRVRVRVALFVTTLVSLPAVLSKSLLAYPMRRRPAGVKLPMQAYIDINIYIQYRSILIWGTDYTPGIDTGEPRNGPNRVTTHGQS